MREGLRRRREGRDLPVDPEHDRQVRVRRRAGRTCDVEVEAVELRLLQRLVGDAVLGEVEELLFDALEFWLGTYRPVGWYSCALAHMHDVECVHVPVAGTVS